MGLLFKAGVAFGFAAWMLGTGPFAGPPAPRWDEIRTELAAAQPRARLAAQAEDLFHAGMPRPAAAETVR